MVSEPVNDPTGGGVGVTAEVLLEEFCQPFPKVLKELKGQFLLFTHTVRHRLCFAHDTPLH